MSRVGPVSERTNLNDGPNDTDQIKAAAADYIEGWYSGDVETMERCLHENLVKRTPIAESGDLRMVTKARMLELTAAGGGESPDPDFDTVVFEISGDIATARVTSPEYVDFLQLAKTPDGWKIVNVLFRTRD